jgi:hypothetical protein
MELAHAVYSTRRGRYDIERWNNRLGKALWHYLLISGRYTDTINLNKIMSEYRYRNIVMLLNKCKPHNF